MPRWFLMLLLAVAGMAQEPSQPKDKPPEEKQPQLQPDQLPPEEDPDARPEVYSFNPVKSKRDVDVGLQYFKKGKYEGAAARFLTATKWNDGNAEAWLHLAETEEKRGNLKAAREAYQHYLQLAPDAKNAEQVKKRLEKLKG